ncbi:MULTISPECIES: sigma-70 family RNA polymerase sigma factor [unclassified Mesorhizobium]|uniref:sigma-70 family RNA polymerase sigma factor n=1 Tax=unclassified Mesorhizobium TaxID=325217 RepID=UPI000FDBCD8E|nr:MULTISPECIES: sigma-70 family RNA polymerase sigma factor [unclassified Mesorhizobium]TGQ42744.1 sigma-70 family RNA polymerase sigma factor [Mesorhizobium sp. M00.F.Ca.ET.216.01.1.1]TIS54025.1 MAG: sigma-70 family RNA polymerase sigma factor [Mesorhizobium sp.]TIS86291.1 MAG: sigma-70 family RNA polymerase sigma factor [Mesorhizobium sp.]TJW14584.1 MAG: sigma-70 family RNA polymerase sigma factor [Mesorhizobium sp.]TJW45003.1 MAG: sigma-70 family RNA polymerase sigma factor [Mesorhizobium 
MTGHQHELEKRLSEMRPKLHRYCARMVGSTIDAEDVVQDACLKAVAAWGGEEVANPDGWLFRIAHNTALDFLRRRRRAPAIENLETLEMIATPPAPDPQAAAASIRTFMRLPPLQRSAVVMKDVLGHSLEEIAEVNGVSAPAAKSALQRGRASLRAFTDEPQDIDLPILPDETRKRLTAYVDGFRNGDFDAVRAMLAEDVRLDLVSKLTRGGKSEVGEYYGRYAACEQWAFEAGAVEGRPAMLVYDREVSLDQPAYFVALSFSDGQVVSIHDFLFAHYAIEGVRMQRLQDR